MRVIDRRQDRVVVEFDAAAISRLERLATLMLKSYTELDYFLVASLSTREVREMAEFLFTLKRRA
jgi:cytidylate kinase